MFEVLRQVAVPQTALNPAYPAAEGDPAYLVCYYC